MINKMLLSLIIFVAGVSHLNAQSLLETENVKYWKYKYSPDWRELNDTIVGWFSDDYETYILARDTLLTFQGVSYLWVSHDTPNRIKPLTTFRPDRRFYSIGIRLEDGKVYTNFEDFCEYQNFRFNYDYFYQCCWSFSDPNYLPYHLTEDGSELILYDYTMEVGDGFRHVDGHDDITVVEKDTVAYADDVPRRRLTLSNGLIIIEGMGCINSNGMLIDWLNPAEEYQSNFTYLDYCADDWNKPFNIIYTHEDSGLHVVDTNPAGIESLHSSDSSDRHALFDLQGRRLIQKPARGVYIQDGRKVVIK